MGELADRITDASTSKRDKLGRIAELLEQSGIDLDEVGRIDKVRIGEHQVPTKIRRADGTDEVEIHNLRADSLVLTPTWADGPAWPVIRPAETYGVKAKEMLCRSCLSQLSAILNGSHPTQNSASPVTSEGTTGRIESDCSNTGADAGRRRRNESSRSGDTTSPPSSSTGCSPSREASAESAELSSRGVAVHGTSTTTTVAARRRSGVAAGVCVVCFAPCVTPTSAGSRRSTTKKPSSGTSTSTSARTTLILPDTQIGYRRMEDGSLEPIHDEQAMAAGLEVARLIHPHRIVNLGDYLDLAQWSSKFLVTPEFYFTTQPAIDRGHLYLAEQRAIVGPDGEVVLFGGNHDNRMALAIARNAAEALRLRRANLPESWPVMSMPHLLRLDELGVEYIGAYPAGKKKLADAHGRQTPLYARHGTGAGDVRKDARGLRQSFVQGHGHHLSVHAETYEVDDEPQDVEVWSLGCLCRLDGWVNSTKSGEHDNGRPFKQWESWQHAVGIVTEFDGGGWDVQAVRIRDGRAVVNGRQVAA